jgi:hypothetical protein
MSPTSAREYTQAATGSAVIDTPEGEAVFEGDQPKLVDPESVGSTLGILGSLSGFGTMLLGPYAPLVAAGIEYNKPGATVEAGTDIADLAGEAIEMGPEVAGELLMRRGGVGTLKRVGGQAGLAAAGTALRRGVSETLPGEDIGMEETLKRAGTNAVLSGMAEGPTALGAPVAELPRVLIDKGAPVSAAEVLLGKTLRGKGSPAAEREAATDGPGVAAAGSAAGPAAAAATATAAAAVEPTGFPRKRKTVTIIATIRRTPNVTSAVIIKIQLSLASFSFRATSAS